jgi:hypothetical protein
VNHFHVPTRASQGLAARAAAGALAPTTTPITIPTTMRLVDSAGIG